MTNLLHMVGARTRLAVGAALLFAPGVVASAAATTPTVLLTGVRSASIVVTFAHPVTVFYGDPAYGERGPTITGGDPVGFLLARLDGQVIAGAVVTTKADVDGKRTLATVDGVKATVPRGTYRLTLVASGPAQVRIPVDGLRTSVTYRPTTPVTVRTVDVPVMSPAGVALPASPSATGRVTTTIGARTVLIGAFRHHSTGNGETNTFCLTPVASGCPDGAVYVETSDATLGGLPHVAEPTGYTTVVVPGVARPGRYDVVWTVQTKGVGSDEHATLITIG